ncbi:hypothetical protein [Virgibacillus litoralis]|uniref:Ribulose 1,5-bisphosphate synthetase/thiazole synthase n=1 Tax=Virgibacillus litoralis TaxID=578221 RepID=A0ABS4HEH4_9BACI|nr:hypothetical protein [Virgibacillus litoralis]MBP1949312.1 ribulose 1,5-bisphosphate synthetase/thiazole synthase [Virgibacillus litoralis]
MTELLFYSLIFGLFLGGMVAFRLLMQHHVNQVFKSLDVDLKPEKEAVKVRPITKPSFVLQESTERLKD